MMTSRYTLKLLAGSAPSFINSFVSPQKHASFLQSFEWGEFQEALGREVIRKGVFEEAEEKILLGSALFIKHRLPLGKYYWYCPRGPILTAASLCQPFINYAAEQKGIFLRIEPLNAINEVKGALHTASIQPSCTIILDILRSENDILGKMHEKTRYNIRLAEKRGVKVKWSEKPGRGEVNDFISLIQETAKRHSIKAHPAFYYSAMIRLFCMKREGNAPYMNMCTAYYNNQPIAGNLVMFFGDTATYLHGGSSNAHKNFMASYLLQWESIKRAKAMGHRYYDFWGIAEDGGKDHRLAGVTRFKKGFGGVPYSFPQAFDFPFQKKWHYLYRIARKMVR